MNAIIDKVKSMLGAQQSVAGPINEANSGMRLGRPYRERYNNGIFVSHDNVMYKFYLAPSDVQVDFVDNDAMITNQKFFTDISNEIGKKLEAQSHGTRKDKRIRFHVSMSKELTSRIETFDGISPSQEEFIERISTDNNMGKPLIKPVWRTFIGFEILPGDIISDAYGIGEKAAAWYENFTDERKRFLTIYRENLKFMDDLARRNGLRELNFSRDPLDEELLTAWFGESESPLGQKRAPETTRLSVFKHGQSLITPKWGEVSMMSVRPADPDQLGEVDPVDPTDAKFSSGILHPKAGVVHLSIKGQIRSPRAIADIIDAKQTSAATAKESNDKGAEQEANLNSRMELADIAVAAATEAGMAPIDNVEFTIAVTVDAAREKFLNTVLRGYGLEAIIVEGRQHKALCTTIPAYPGTIYRVPAANMTRNRNTMQFYSGVLSMSGLFGSIKPCASNGVLLGLSQSYHDLKEVYSTVCDGNAPVKLYTGVTGSGKTVQALMEMDQVSRMGIPVFFLNPKPNGKSPEEMFKLLDGVIIKMDRKFLKDNPGLLDPAFYMDDPEDVADILVEMILEGMAMKSERSKKAVMERAALKQELLSRAKMPENRCSWDIIAGNTKYATPKLSNDDIIDFVRIQRDISPFWKSSISHDRTGANSLRDRIRSGKPVYIEWGSSMAMPNTTNRDDWGDDAVEAVRSVVNMFKYAVAVSVANGRGVVAIDEAHNLKASEQAMGMILKAGKEWRASGLELWLMTQKLTELVKTPSSRGIDDGIIDITDTIGQFVMMTMDEGTLDVDVFFDLTKLPRTPENVKFITSGKPNPDTNKLPTAFYLNRSERTPWSGGIVCGPWPRTDFKAAIGEAIVEDSHSSIINDDDEGLFEDIVSILTENEASNG